MTFFPVVKGATSKRNKVRKSSNNRDSHICDTVVHTTPPSHAAAAQAVPAAAASPTCLAVASIAAAPMAAFNATVTAFTEYDKYIQFDNFVVDVDGGWGAHGDKMTGKSSGRSLLTPQHNKTTTAHAATTRVLQDQVEGYDINIVDVFTPPPAGALKGNLPLGFVPIRILDDIKLCLLSKLDVNSSASNINAFWKSFLKGIMDDIVDVKNNLLLYAEQVHFTSIFITKLHNICKHLVECGTS